MPVRDPRRPVSIAEREGVQVGIDQAFVKYIPCAAR